MKHNSCPKIFCSLLGLMLVGNLDSIAHAEGSHSDWSGANGVNRRVQTTTNYIGVSGKFSMPTFYIPVLYVGNDYTKPIINPNLVGTGLGYTEPEFNGDPDHGIAAYPYRNIRNAGSNPQNDKPSMYLGSGIGHGSRVDAGLQWEWLPLNGAPPGWSLFLRDPGWHTPKVSQKGSYKAGEFRAGPNTNNPAVTQFQLTHIIIASGANQGRDYLTTEIFPKTGNFNAGPMTVIGGNPGPYSTSQIGSPTSPNSIWVKRVIAMTQRGPAKLDGSWMRGCTFSEGSVAVLKPSGVDWHLWGIEDVDNTQTGYVPGLPPANKRWPLHDKDMGNPRRFIVDFPQITALANANGLTNEKYIRANLHNAFTSLLEERYSEEQVDINLQTGTNVAGVEVIPGK